MRWTPWFVGVNYGYRQRGNGAFVDVELGYFPNNELAEPTIFLQGDEATAFVDEIERMEADEDITFRIGLGNAVDEKIADYFDDRML